MAPTGEPESCSKCLSSWQTFLKKFRFLSIINVFSPFCSSIVRKKRRRNWIPIKNARQQRRGTFNVYVCSNHSPFAELAVAHSLMPDNQFWRQTFDAAVPLYGLHQSPKDLVCHRAKRALWPPERKLRPSITGSLVFKNDSKIDEKSRWQPIEAGFVSC